MNEFEKRDYYRSEYMGAPHVDHINFRCPKRLAAWLRMTAMDEGRDTSMILRRLLTWAAIKEGFNEGD